ncbi:hypothetical protein [Actibacterium sp. 188UL27-1]|uniref:hypothetical protein n=1 Tax=Actibacterium sp. 188UL27-1 TaxID=2786961 RepID=UPI00195F1DBA|nr:hypothetical protein [Actibacterium sp. 188UL27-1]MBM7066600.1 hypothetical protein [Actibacterium sp. 188UL27-1]
MIRFSIAVCALLGVAACASPQQSQNLRDQRLVRQFPNPADRVGLHVVFASGRGFITSYQPQVIPEQVALARTGQVCRATGQGNQAVLANRLSGSTATLGNGSQVPIAQFKANCV